MTEKELRDNWRLFKIGWELFKEYSEPDGSDEFWESLRSRVIELDKQYESRMLHDILIAVMSEIKKYDVGPVKDE